MSILTNGLIDYRVPNFRDHTDMLARLSPTMPVLIRVGDYLRSVLPVHKDTYPVWTPVHDYTYFAYCGPGGFSVMFGPRVAVIVASCRYSAFATMPPLQAAHLPAFISVARALGGTRLVLMPDDDRPLGDAALYDGASLDECVARIQKAWGDPHPTTEVVTDDIEVYNRRKFPVWHVETLNHAV